MAAEEKRGILIETKTRSDLSELDATIKKLGEITAAVARLNATALKLNIDTAALDKSLAQIGTIGQAGKAGGNTEVAERQLKNYADKFRDLAREMDTVVAASKRVETTLPNGVLRNTLVEQGLGLKGTVVTDSTAAGQLIRTKTSIETNHAAIQKADAQAQQAAADEIENRAQTNLARRAATLRLQATQEANIRKEDLANQASAADEIENRSERNLARRLGALKFQAAQQDEFRRSDLEKQKTSAEEIDKGAESRLAQRAAALRVQEESEAKQRLSTQKDLQREIDQIGKDASIERKADFDQQKISAKSLQRELDSITNRGKLENDLNRISTRRGGSDEITRNVEGFQRLTREVDTNANAFANAVGKVALWTVATGTVFGTLHALRDGIRTFSDVEQATVSLERVGRGFGEGEKEKTTNAREATKAILDLKVAYGSTGTEAQQAAVTFARLGLTQREVVEAVRISLLAANVAGIGVAEAAQLMASAMSQFQLSVSDLPDILNKLNTLENTTRVTTKDLLDSISRAGGVFREAGGSFEELAAITAVVAQVTSRSGAEIGNAFKTIASRIGEADVQAKVFHTTGVVLGNIAGELKPIDRALGDLAIKMIELNEAGRVSTTTDIAGVRQRNQLQAALDNYFEIQAKVIRQYAETNSAEQENARVTQTLASKVEQLKASAERLAFAFGEAGLGSAAKGVISLLKNFNLGLAESNIAIRLLSLVITGALTIALTNLAVGFISARAGAQGLTFWVAALNAVGGVPGLIAIGASIALFGIAAYKGSQSVAALNEQMRENKELAETNVRATTNQLKAIEKTVELLKDAKEAFEALDRAEKNGSLSGEEAGKKRKQIHEAISTALSDQPALLTRIANGEIGIGEAIGEANKERERRNDLDTDAQNKVVTLQGRQKVDATERLTLLLQQEKKLREELAQLERDRESFTPKIFQEEKDFLEQEIDSFGPKIQKARDELTRLRVDLNDATSKRDQSKKGEKEEPFSGVFPDIKTLEKNVRKFEKFDRRKVAAANAGASTPLEHDQNELAGLRRRQANLQDIFEGLPGNARKDFVEFLEKELTDVGDAIEEKLAEIANDKLKAGIQKQGEVFKKEIKSAFKLKDALADFAAEGGAPNTEGIRKAQNRVLVELKNQKQLQEELNRLKGLTGGSDEEKVIRAAQIRNVENELVESGIRLEDRKNGVLEAGLKIINDQTKAQQKQFEQNKRELGQLSDLDLVRLRISANNINSGKQGPLSQADFLNSDKSTRDFAGLVDRQFPGFVPNIALGDFNKFSNRQQANPFPQSDAAKELRDTIRSALFGPDAKSAGQRFDPSLLKNTVNVNVGLEALQVPVDRLAQDISTLLAAKVQDLLDLNVQRVETAVTSKFRAPVRSK